MSKEIIRPILRRIRIGKLTGHYKENDLEAINFIQMILNKMILNKTDDYPDKIFYCLVSKPPLYDKVYFEMKFNEHVTKATSQKSKNDYLYCRYEDFWQVLREKFLLNYNDIQSLIKYMVEQHLKQEVGTPRPTHFEHDHMVEQHLKQEVGTPVIGLPSNLFWWNNISNVT